LDFENEKRKYPRVEVNWPVTIYFDNKTIEGVTTNISVEGVSLQCDKPLPVNKDFSILISPPEHQAIDLKGRVVWSDLYGIDGAHKIDVYGIGACLVKLSEEDKQTVREMLNNYL
jgi:hypothetical protein